MSKNLTNQIIEKALISVRWNADIVLPNFYYGMFEMDVFRLTSSGFVIEYEVKISRADFNKDKSKGISYYMKGEFHKKNKHDLLKSKDIPERKMANRFFYVVPEGLIKKEECPEFAGLMYYTGYSLVMIKNAPLLHKEKVSDKYYVGLCRKLAFREQNLRFKIIRLNNQR